MAWIQYVDPGYEGVGGSMYWVDDATGAVSYTDPTRPPVTIPEGISATAVDNGGGFEGQGGTSLAYSIFGVPYDQYKTEYSGTGPNGRQAAVTTGPDGRTERSYWVQGPGGPLILPESLAKQFDPNAIPYEQTADGGYGGFGGFLDQAIVPALMAGVGAAGAMGLGAGAGAAADIGSAAFPLDAGTIAGMNGTGAVSVGAGSVASNLTAYPLGNGMDPSIWEEMYSGWPSSPATNPNYDFLSEIAGGYGNAPSGKFGLDGLTSAMSTVAEKIGPSAAKSLFDRWMSGDASAFDMIGKIAPAALGALGSIQSGSAYKDLAEKYMGFGAPSRARYEATFQPGFTMESDPGYKDALDQTTKSFLHKASITGNPADSPNAWMQTLKDVNSSFAYPALQNYRQVNANTGGLAAFTPAAINAESAATGSNRGVYDAIGYGMADIFNPKRSLADLLKEARV